MDAIYDERLKLIGEVLAYSLKINNRPTFGLNQNIPWESIYELLGEHAVAELCGDVLYEFPIPEKVREKWDADVFRCIANYYEYCRDQEELVQILTDHKVPFVILKGLSSARYYPFPHLRRMGDIDILTQREQIEPISELLKSKGFIEEKEDERHCSFVREGTEIELHWTFAPLKDGSPSELDKRLLAAIEHAEWIPDGGEENLLYPVLPRVENGLVLLEHLRHHMWLGQGLRQIIDWMMFVHNEMNEQFWQDEFEKAADQYRLLPLTMTTTRMCQMFFSESIGGQWCRAADDRLCNQLMDYVISCGNFGKSRGKKSAEAHVKMFMERRGGVLGAMQSLQKDGEYSWTALKDHPELRPFAWAYRIVRSAKKLSEYHVTPEQLMEHTRHGEETEALLRYLQVEKK